MTAATARRSPQTSTRAAAPPDDRLAGLLADLGQLEVHARVLTQHLVGDPDVRVQAWRDGGQVTAELLWCDPDAPMPPGLDAVRISGPRRQVWRGPACRSFPADAVRFLCDLLLLDEDALARRYQPLG